MDLTRRIIVEGINNNSRGISAIALWVALFWGDPDIADAIIHALMN